MYIRVTVAEGRYIIHPYPHLPPFIFTVQSPHTHISAGILDFISLKCSSRKLIKSQ
uniref:Uncharacterized protein n=1 Tax=Anguilla anguilla TaxID=7936 RepID=A0A0E9V8I3_ANGAN